MTLAAIASQLLNDCLVDHQVKDGQADFAGLASRFQKQLGKELIAPWQQATNEDMRWPETEGKQALTPAMRLVNNYFGQVMQAMPHSAKVTDAATKSPANQDFFVVLWLITLGSVKIHIK